MKRPRDAGFIMTRVLSFIGAKGGTLKTTSSASLAHLMASLDLRVVMVDGDPQGDLTKRSGYSRVDNPASAEPVQVEYPKARPLDLWLLRSGRALEGSPLSVMQRQIQRARDLDPDVIVIDTPPALGPITTAAIQAADLIVVGLMPGREGVEGFHDVAQLARLHGDAPVRVLYTLVKEGTNIFQRARADVDEILPGAAYRSYIVNEVGSAEAAYFDAPPTVTLPQSKTSLAYMEIAEDVIRRFHLQTGGRHAAMQNPATTP